MICGASTCFSICRSAMPGIANTDMVENAAARTRGFQGDDLTHWSSLLATPKHFAAYGAVSGGMDYNSVEIASHTLREVHLPPFKAAFDAGALSPPRIPARIESASPPGEAPPVS